MNSGTLSRITLLTAAILISLICAVLCAIMVPIGRGADEDEHLDYVFHLLEVKTLPDPRTEPVGQAQHPPLPYVMLAPLVSMLDDAPLTRGDEPVEVLGRRTTLVPSATQSVEEPTDRPARRLRRDRTPEGALHGLRGLSVLFGLITALLLFGALAQVTSPGVAVVTTAFFILSPHYPFHFSMVSNDPWMTLLGAASAWHAVRARRNGHLTRPRTLILGGMILGLGFLTKLHAIGPAAFVTMLVWGAHERRTPIQRKALSLLLLAAGPLLLAGWWHIRQVGLQGGLLSVQHHAEFKPWLLRLGEWNPVILLEVLARMVRTVFAGFGGDLLQTWEIYFVLPTGLFMLTIFGAFRRVKDRGEVDDHRPVVPLRAALTATALVVAAVLLANRDYYHVHGRYLYSVLVPMAFITVEGARRLFGSARTSVLTLGAAWNLIFCVATVFFVVGGRYTIPAEKMTRGHVIDYFDCGNDVFDQDAGGMTQTRRFPQLHLPEETQRFSFQATPTPDIVYRSQLPDPTKRYQIRVRYPSPFNPTGGDTAAPNGCAMLVNSWTLHGPHSLWNELGEMHFPVPEAVAAVGKLEIWWQNRHPLSGAVGVSELWVEEAWVRLEEPPTIRRQMTPAPVEAWVKNGDPASAHSFAAFLMQGARVLATWDGPTRLEPGESRRIQFEVEDPIPPTTSLRVALRDIGAGPFVSTKVAQWAFPGRATGGTTAVPDVRVLRYDPSKDGEKPLAAFDLGRFLPGDYLIGASVVGDGDAAAALALTVEGLELLEAEAPRPDPHGLGTRWFPRRARLDGKARDVMATLLGTGQGEPVTLDRFYIIRAPDAPGVFHRYEIVER